MPVSFVLLAALAVFGIALSWPTQMIWVDRRRPTLHLPLTVACYRAVMSPNLPAEELRRLLVTMLAGAAGGTEAAWDARLGEMVRTDLATRPTSNWTIKPVRTCWLGDRAAIARAVELVKAEHPYVSW